MNKLHESILQDLIFAKVEDAVAIIRTMLIAFDVEEVTQDVVDAIKEEYLK